MIPNWSFLLSSIRYVNKLPFDIPSDQRCKTYIFADDTAITAMYKSPRYIVLCLQRFINSIEKWLSDWRIAINPSKTEAIYFTKTRLREPVTKVKVKNLNIDWGLNARYLGLHFNRKLSWNGHIILALKKANNQLGALYCLLNHKSKLNTSTKINIYKSMLRPILLYGASTWCNTHKTNFKKLQTFQNKILRIINHAPRYTPIRVLHRDMQLPTIKEFLMKNTIKYFDRTNVSTNPLIRHSHVNSNLNDTYKLPKDFIR